MPKGSCGGSVGPVRLIVACSGAADVGEIADHVGRRLAKDRAGRMTCLAGVGGRVPAVMENLALAEAVWAIDGCQEDCARRTLELAGFTATKHLRVTDYGLEKGQSPATDESVAAVLHKAQTHAVF